MADPRTDRAPEELRHEVATIQSDPLRYLYGGRVLTEDAILRTRGAGKGLGLYDELLRDPQVATVMGKRIDALIGREWVVQSGAEGDARADDAAELVRGAVNGLAFSRAVGKFSQALLKGVAVIEVMWTARDAALVPALLQGRDPRRFAFRAVAGGSPVDGTAVELRLLTRDQAVDGIAVPARKFIVHRFGEQYENPWGLGLGHRLFWPVYFKRQGISFWMQGLDKFSQPTAVGKYPNGAGQPEKDTLLAALAAVSREAGVIIPEGMAVELLEAKRSGTFDAYESLARYMDEDIAKAVLGETLSTQVGNSGSRALGEVHNEVRLEIVKADADRLAETINSTLVRWIVDLNLPDYAATGLPYPALWWDVSEPEDLAARAKRDVDVASLGYRPTQDYIDDTYGAGWQPHAAPAPTAPPAFADALAALFAEAGRPGQRTTSLPLDPTDAADDLTAQLGPATAPHVAAWMEPLGQLVRNAGSMEEIARGLVALYPRMQTADLAELLGQALAVADLTGRLDLQEGRVPPGGDA
jgi:phage gp29-like protein